MRISLGNTINGLQARKTVAGSQPYFTAQPSILPASAAVGSTFALGLGAASGSPGPSVAGQLLLDGVDVTDEIALVAGTLRYVATAAGALSWRVTASNPSGTAIATPVSSTVTAAAPGAPLQVTMGTVTFTVDGATAVGLDAAGKAWAVVPTGSATVTMTPDQVVNGSSQIVNGAMKNPQRTSDSAPDQGYDQRMSKWNASLNPGSAITVAAGDVIVKTVAKPTPISRAGYFSETAALHILPSAPSGEFLLPASIGWDGRTQLAPYPIDLDAWYAGRTVYSSAGMNFPPYATLMASLSKFSPTIAQVYNANADGGYEGFSTYGLGGNDANYGEDIARLMSIAMLAIQTDVYSEAQTKAVAARILQHGIEWGDPALGLNQYMGSDGGHYQFWQGPYVFALRMTGRTASIPEVMARVPGNWDQPFLVTSQIYADDFVPHDDPERPAIWRLRTLGAQPGGATVRIPVAGTADAGDWNQTKIPVGSRAVRRSDGATAIVTAETALDTSGTVDVPLDGPSPFVQGDTIYFQPPPAWIAPGLYDWSIRGFNTPIGRNAMYSPAGGNNYRNVQGWGGQLVALKAMGLVHPSMDAVEGYMVRAQAVNVPAAGNDYPPMIKNWVSAGTQYTAPTTFFNTHWAQIAQVQGVFGAVTPVLTTAVHPSATTPPATQRDGVVIGLAPGATEALVQFSGTVSGGDDVIEVRVLRQSDGSVVRDWTPIGVSGSGRFSGGLSLPRGDGWWRAEARAKGNRQDASALGAAFGVGYKFLFLGQSQMTILLSAASSYYSPQTDNFDTASYYKWQEAGGVAEDLRLIGSGVTGDGLNAFLDQFRVFDPTTPVEIVRESVNGTSVVQFLDDQTAGREWSDLRRKVDRFGGDFTAVLSNWGTSNSSPLGGDAGKYFDMLMGTNAHGFGVDHALTEVLQPGFGFVVSPLTHHSYSLDTWRADEVAEANLRGWTVGPPIPDYPIEDGGTAHPDLASQGNAVFGARMAVGAARYLGLDASRNPSLANAVRSADGTQITISFNLPNGGSLFSPAPEDVKGFLVNETSGTPDPSSTPAHTARIVGNTVVLTRDSGVWAGSATLRVALPNDPRTGSSPAVLATELDLVAGALYETWPSDVLGLGLPVLGQFIGGKWVLPNVNVPLPVTQASAAGPGQFQTGDWSVADAQSGGALTVTVTALPTGAPFTGIEYQVGSGSWTASGIATTGTFQITGLANGTAANVALRAVSTGGSGPASTPKSATPTGGARTIATVFADAGAGDYFDFTDASRLFTDLSGSLQVQADGDAVRLARGIAGRLTIDTAVANQPPTYRTDQVRPNIQFLGGQVLSRVMAVGAGYTVVAAVLSANKSATRYIVDADNGTPGAARVAQMLKTNTGGAVASLGFDTSGATAEAAGTSDIVGMNAVASARMTAAGAISVRVGGMPQGSAAVGASPRTGSVTLGVGARLTGNPPASLSGPFSGRIYRLAVIPTLALSDADLAIVEAWCGAALV